jgi:hypothetical protein
MNGDIALTVESILFAIQLILNPFPTFRTPHQQKNKLK